MLIRRIRRMNPPTTLLVVVEISDPGAADADAAHLHAPPDPVDHPTLGDVALDHRAPTAELDQTLLVAVLLGEHALLVVARPGAVAVDRLPVDPGRTAELVELGEGGEPLKE